MSISPLQKLAQMIRSGAHIENQDMLDLLGEEVTIVVPREGGGERRLPSGEILAVLAEGTGKSVDDVLANNFGLTEGEIESARTFINLVQFTGGMPPDASGQEPMQPFQPVDH